MVPVALTMIKADFRSHGNRPVVRPRQEPPDTMPERNESAALDAPKSPSPSASASASSASASDAQTLDALAPESLGEATDAAAASPQRAEDRAPQTCREALGHCLRLCVRAPLQRLRQRLSTHHQAGARMLEQAAAEHLPPMAQGLRDLGLDVDGPRFRRLRQGLGYGGRLAAGPLGRLLLLTALVCLLLILAVDRPVAEAARQADPSIIGFFRAITDAGKSEWYLLVAFALALFYRFLYRSRAMAMRAWFVFLAVALSGIAVNIIKVLFGRARPKLLWHPDNPTSGFDPLRFEGAWQSFPSGHTSTVVALALCGWILMPRLWPLWAGFALVIASSRVMTGAHYPADLVAGAVVTWLVVEGIRRWIEAKGYRLTLAPRR